MVRLSAIILVVANADSTCQDADGFVDHLGNDCGHYTRNQNNCKHDDASKTGFVRGDASDKTPCTACCACGGCPAPTCATGSGEGTAYICPEGREAKAGATVCAADVCLDDDCCSVTTTTSTTTTSTTTISTTATSLPRNSTTTKTAISCLNKPTGTCKSINDNVISENKYKNCAAVVEDTGECVWFGGSCVNKPTGVCGEINEMDEKERRCNAEACVWFGANGGICLNEPMEVCKILDEESQCNDHEPEACVWFGFLRENPANENEVSADGAGPLLPPAGCLLAAAIMMVA